MEPLDILRADPLDLLFENRNKSYGAYPLRKYYGQRLLISLAIVFSLVIVAAFFYPFFQRTTFNKSLVTISDIHLKPFDWNLPVKPILPTKFVNTRPRTSVEYVTPVIVQEQQVPPLATIEDLKETAIDLKNTKGRPEDRGPEILGTASGLPETTTDSASENPEIYEQVDNMPQFPGGEEALRRFLLKNLRMPENNLETGSQVKVTARFVVGADGKVRDIEIIQSADDRFNQEVKRVILKMPEWKPGMQHKRCVAVYFVLPVNFVAEE